MSEHEEFIERMERLEKKLDLLTQALGFAVKRCDDSYHLSKTRYDSSVARMQDGKPCPTCNGWERELAIESIED